MSLKQFVYKLVQIWLGIFIGTWLAALTSKGIAYASLPTLLGIAFILSVLNLVVKPILVLFTLPFVMLTLGLGMLFINAFLFWLVGHWVPGFTVASFASAFWGALLCSLITLMILAIFSARVVTTTQHQGQSKRARFTDTNSTRSTPDRRHSNDDDIIDI